ncbi:hypothetical protein [Shinella zoogloeoides]|uniref:hypothetical protein n=1 Tax=Shinella zoogloeoides TaxID=352475 RepID=UPI00299CEDFF|nr:hypothetical protein [Shinella zoogloeoides]
MQPRGARDHHLIGNFDVAIADLEILIIEIAAVIRDSHINVYCRYLVAIVVICAFGWLISCQFDPCASSCEHSCNDRGLASL